MSRRWQDIARDYIEWMRATGRKTALVYPWSLHRGNVHDKLRREIESQGIETQEYSDSEENAN